MTTLFCPKCDYPQYCGCSSSYCRDILPVDMSPQIELGGEVLGCAKCGFSATIDEWADIEFQLMRREREIVSNKSTRTDSKPTKETKDS